MNFGYVGSLATKIAKVPLEMFVHRSAAAGAGKPSRQVGIACDLTVRVLQPRARAKRFLMSPRTVGDSHSSYWYNRGASFEVPNVKHQFI